MAAPTAPSCTAGPTGQWALRGGEHTAAGAAPTEGPGGYLPEAGQTLEALCTGSKWTSLTPTGPDFDAFWNIPLVDVPAANVCRMAGARGLYFHPGSTIFQSCGPKEATQSFCATISLT